MKTTAIIVLLSASALFAAGPEFDYEKTETIMVPMRDGVRLSTDVYLPARNGQAVAGRYPVILFRSPYNKRGERGSDRPTRHRQRRQLAQDHR